MSQQPSISPPAVQFREPSSALPSSRYPPASSSNTPTSAPSFFERRRTSHPHNRHVRPLHRASEGMANISQSSQPTPRLEHRSSQTIIDLTDEPEETGAVSRGPSQRPPQLGRSDASGLTEFIDLTDDDIVITGGRELPRPRPQENRHPREIHFAAMRDDSPSLFLPAHPPRPQHSIRRVFANPMNAIGVALGFRIPEAGGPPAPHHGAFHAAHFMEQMQLLHGMDAQNMPGLMDYRQPAFAAPKPEHVPPKPARENFTRSPKEDDIIICPSCEEELVDKKEAEEPIAKKTGRALSRKDREEHPFWVIKECGHVSSIFVKVKTQL